MPQIAVLSMRIAWKEDLRRTFTRTWKKQHSGNVRKKETGLGCGIADLEFREESRNLGDSILESNDIINDSQAIPTFRKRGGDLCTSQSIHIVL